jgi:PAS domain S-box-containing protein
MDEDSEATSTLPEKLHSAEAKQSSVSAGDATRSARILAMSHESLIVRDKDGRIVSWNGAAERLYGWTAVEATGRMEDSLLKTKFPTALAEIESKLYASGQWEGELLQTARDGRELVVRSRWCLEADGEGSWLGILQVENDITQRKHLEEELRQVRAELEHHAEGRMTELQAANEALVESQTRFQQMAEAIRDVFWLTNPWRTSIIYVNPAYEQIWGRTCQSLYANPRSWLEGVHPEDRPRMRQFFAKRISAQGYEQSYRVVRPDCSVRWVLDRGFPVRDSTGGVDRVVGIARDITEHKALEKELLAISEREQRRIGQDLHDDLCQQLVGIEFLSKALQQQLKAQPPADKAAEIAQLIRAAIGYTRQLARGLAPFELETEGLMRGLQVLAGRTTELFRVQCSFQCPSAVLVRDPTVCIHLYRIAQEAVTNSIKHGKATWLGIELTTKPEGGVLTVKDNGLGFSGDTYSSGGLGLRIMQHRADMIGGTLCILNEGSLGTKLVCTFPLTAW